jgi:hypothetical protein
MYCLQENETLSPPAQAFLRTLDALCEGQRPIKGTRSLLVYTKLALVVEVNHVLHMIKFK